MAGVFTVKGMSLRIPQGGLRVRVDDDGGIVADPLVLEVALDVWEHWLEIAEQQVSAAERARDALESADREDDDEARAQALGEELRAGMLAICAGAFAIDSFYACVKERLSQPADENQRAARSGGRADQITEVLVHGFDMSEGRLADVRQRLKELFRYRNWAVHAPAEFKPAILHPVIGSGVEWRFVAFRVENCRVTTQFTKSLISQLMDRPKEEHTDLVRWCRAYEERPH